MLYVKMSLSIIINIMKLRYKLGGIMVEYVNKDAG